ncbi:serine protease [Lithospermum erythrorhizon]|uniref:Serine protease n=1 Tax=Lithospermum erythrorhizon TaxID=34254 RepID=A0AAV3QDU4_LITER
MSKFTTFLSQKWLPTMWELFISIISVIIFTFLDFLDVLMCIFYKLVDEILEGKASSCYCIGKEEGKDKKKESIEVDYENELSETLYNRKNVFRQLGLLNFLGLKRFANRSEFVGGAERRSKWSDCGCDSCGEWMNNGNDLRLHIVVNEPQKAPEDCKGTTTENVIFLHGFMASSSLFTNTIFPSLSESIKQNYKLFAVDLLGFGKSPKPQECLYTMRDHVQMIENSVIKPFQLDSFHLVAHSMGCVIALALAARYSKSVKSVTLIAPPYFPSEENASITALERLAARRIWPLLLFGSSFMSWYEHLGRCVCYILCRHHQTWERIFKLITRQRVLHHRITDITKHTHHSAWHTMHNVICGGAKLMDGYLESLTKERVKVYVIYGTKDEVVPLECYINIKKKVANAEVCVVENADHSTVILGREVDFSKDLEHAWRGM